MKIKTSPSYTTYENVLKYHEKHQFKATTDTETCTLLELLYTASLLEKVVVLSISPLKQLITLVTKSY